MGGGNESPSRLRDTLQELSQRIRDYAFILRGKREPHIAGVNIRDGPNTRTDCNVDAHFELHMSIQVQVDRLYRMPLPHTCRGIL